MPGAIAYLASSFPKRSETFVYREVRALRQRGWTVHVACLHRPDEPSPPEFADLEAGKLVVYIGRARLGKDALAEWATHPLRSMGTLALAARDALAPGEKLAPAGRLKLIAQSVAGLSLARRLRPAGIERLHCHFAHAPASVGMYAARQLGVPFSFTGHANDIFQRRALLVRKLERAAWVACISRWHREFYRTLAPAAADRLKVIRCGVDISEYAPQPMKEQSPAQPLRILCICRLVEKKGVDTLLRAAAAASARDCLPWTLTVAGDGPDRARLHALAETLQCQAQVQWLGAVTNASVPGLLASADVMALPCRADVNGDRDGIPVALMEAMACGVPVVGGDLPAIAELIEDGVSGRLVAADDSETLAGILAQWWRDPALRQRLAKAGRARVEEEFDLERNVSRLEAAMA